MLRRPLLALVGPLFRGTIPNQLGLTVERFIQHTSEGAAPLALWRSACGFATDSAVGDIAIHLTLQLTQLLGPTSAKHLRSGI